VQEAPETRFAGRRVGAVIDALMDLPEGDETNREAFLSQPRQEFDCLSSTIQVCSHPVAIDEVGHNLTGGREERRRLS